MSPHAEFDGIRPHYRIDGVGIERVRFPDDGSAGRLLLRLDTGDQNRRANFEDLAEFEEHVDGRRFGVLFQQADVVARNPRLGRKGLLRQFRPDSLCTQFIA